MGILKTDHSNIWHCSFDLFLHLLASVRVCCMCVCACLCVCVHACVCVRMCVGTCMSVVDNEMISFALTTGLQAC